MLKRIYQLLSGAHNPETTASSGNESVYQIYFWIMTSSLLLLFPFLSTGFGITWDEWMDSNNGMLALRYLLSGGQDKEFLNFWHGIYYPHLFYCVTGFVYGILFDTVPHFASEGLRNVQNLIPFYTTSHVINSLFGFTAILCAGLITKEIGNWRCACLTILFLALSPRFVGHSMNNPKDIPFAATYILSFYFMIRFFKSFPKPKLATSLLLGVSIATAIGTRAAGLVLLAYLLLFSIAAWLWLRFKKHPSGNPLRLIGHLIGILVIGYFLGLLFWPYGQLAPLSNPFVAFKQMTHFTHWDNPVLFEGAMINASQLPRYYLPEWILITVPLFSIFGLLFLIPLLPRLRYFYNWKWISIISFAILVPTLFEIVNKSVIYDGWRHFLFIYPPLVTLAVLPWDYCFQIAKTKCQIIILTVILGLHLIEPFSWMIRNYPNEYVYFNPLIGGIQGAFGNYEIDYWGNSLRKAAEELANYQLEKNPGKPCVVRIDGSSMSTYPFLYRKLGNLIKLYGYPENFIQKDPYYYLQFPPYLQGPKDWDYAILLPRGWKKEVLKANGWPPPYTIYEVKANRVTLSAVVKNPYSKLQ